MRRILLAAFTAAVALGIMVWIYRPAKPASPGPAGITEHMILTSPSFADGGMIPRKFTCDGGDMNPELQVQNVPEGARSLALILHDPDAPVVGGFTHWVVWNIAPTTTLIKEESVPPGAEEGMNSQSHGYMGPCPPSGTHHYEFFLYALDAPLDLLKDTGKAELETAMQGHIIEEAKLTGLYARQTPQ